MERELVLVADGDRRIRNLIHITLQAHDYKCITATGGESAILMASSNQPTAVLMELNLPDMDGTEVIRKIRSWSDVPIVVISNRLEDHDKVMALDAGADDYITKPFSVEELLARLRVIGRRYLAANRQTEANPVFRNGELNVDFTSGCVFVAGKEIHLTPIEYKILCLLSQNCGKVLTHTDITRKIWGNSWESTVTTLRTFMASLRKKIGTYQNREYIHTHTGVGYRMVLIEN